MKDLNHSAALVLSLGAIASVLAFGGVETLAFAPVEAAIAIFAAVEFRRRGWPSIDHLTAWILGAIVAIPILQLLPLPVSAVSRLSPLRVALVQNVFAHLSPLPSTLPLSVNPYETQLAILRITCYVLVFLLAYRAYQQERSHQPALMVVLIWLGVIESLYGSLQYLTGWQYIYTTAKRYYIDDATGTYINRNHFAGLLEMALPFVMARVLIRHRVPQDTHRSKWKTFVVSPGTFDVLRQIVLFTIVAVGLIFSRSRMGIASATIGLIVVATIVFFQTQRRSILALALLMVAVPAGYSLWIGLTPITERFEVLALPGASEQDRLPVWRDNVDIIRDYPLLGTGLGTYASINARYVDHRLLTPDYRMLMSKAIFEHAHNDYMEFACDIGIPGAVLLFGSLWILAAQVATRALSLRTMNDQILAAGCAGAMISLLFHEITDFNLQIPGNFFIFSWIAGTACALLRKPLADSRG